MQYNLIYTIDRFLTGKVLACNMPINLSDLQHAFGICMTIQLSLLSWKKPAFPDLIVS
jgi:hypothetical protein